MRNFLLGTAVTYLAVTPQGNELAKKGLNISGKMANHYLKTQGLDLSKILQDEKGEMNDEM